MEKDYTYGYFDNSGKEYCTPSLDFAYGRTTTEVYVYENGRHIETLIKSGV